MQNDFRKFQENRTAFPGAPKVFGIFLYIRLNGSLFGDGAILGFSENFLMKFPYHLSPFQKFRNFCLNGMRPRNFDQMESVPCLSKIMQLFGAWSDLEICIR